MSRDPITPIGDNESLKRTLQSTNQGSTIENRVSDITSKVKDEAGHIAETMSEKIGQQRKNAAETLGWAASAVHDTADNIPGGPKLASLTHNIADGMESTASYLRGHDFSQMSKDLMAVCRRYPTQSLVAALALGFLVGRSRR